MSTEVVVGALLGVVFDRLASRHVLNFLHQRKLNEKLNKLKEKLLHTYEAVHNAEQKQFINTHVKEWLDEVKEAMFGEDDPLNEIDYEFYRCELEVESESQTHTSKASEFHESLSDWELVVKTKKQDFGEWVNHNAREIVEKYLEGEEKVLSHAICLEVNKGKNKKEECSNEFIGSTSGENMKDKERSMEAEITDLKHMQQMQAKMLQNLLQQLLQIQSFCVPPPPPKDDTN